MKRQLHVVIRKIDALSLRERIMLFAAAAGTIVFAAHMLILRPLLVHQHRLQGEIVQARAASAVIDSEISTKLQSFTHDADAPVRARLAAVRTESALLGARLRALEQGLVAPDKIAPLLETILAANGKLMLVSMKTLPASAVTAGSERGGSTASGATAPAALLYRHGVQVTVRGNYLDMLNYMDALESMPTQLFWSSADLEVDTYPDARLTLTLHTLSLDGKWITL